MGFKELAQLYGQSAQGAKLDGFVEAILSQHAFSLYNRATSISENFHSVYTRENFVVAFLDGFRNHAAGILFRKRDDNATLLDLELIWTLCERKLKSFAGESEAEVSAILEIGMHIVAHRFEAGQESPYLIVTAGQGRKSFGVCLDQARESVEIWDLAGRKDEFMRHVSGGK